MARVTMSRLLGVLLTLCLGVAAAGANPLLEHFHGHPHGGGGGGGGSVYALDAASGVRADHVDGQTFVSWPDPLNGSGIDDDTKRFEVVRSTTGPITALNYGSATKIASYDLNNSAQLIGGIPNGTGFGYSQTNRQSTDLVNHPMAMLPDANLGGTRSVSYGTGVQAYTALAPQTAYYAVVQTDLNDANPVFLGAVGPIAETPAPAQAIQYAHRTTGYGSIVGTPSGLPLVVVLHASQPDGGAPTNSQYGDVWEWFGDTTQGWQDGMQRVFDVLWDKGGSATYPSFGTNGALLYGNRDGIWAPNGEQYMQNGHFGIGLTPNPLVGPANRFYPITMNAIRANVEWTLAHYNGDPNQVHCGGRSLGAIGCFNSGTHMRQSSDPSKPTFASVWASHPLTRFDVLGSSAWCGFTWGSGWPFSPTLGAAPKVCGTDASAFMMADGVTSFLSFVDLPTYWASNPGTDLPFIAGMDTKDDVNLGASAPLNFQQIINGINALQTAHRGHAFVFYEGVHYTGSDAMGAINCDWTDAIVGVCYRKDLFALNKPYPAFAHDTADDNMGTGTRDANGIYDGDKVGGINIGFNWNFLSDTSSGVSLTVGNSWMHRSPTVFPQATLTAQIPATGTGTFAVDNASVFLTVDANTGTNYDFLIDGNEFVTATVNAAGNTITITGRKQLGTSTSLHNIGATIVQMPSEPQGPMHGPFDSITTDVALHRLQGWHPADGSYPCTVTPDGEAPSSATATVSNGIPVLTGVKINWTGSTSIVCG